MKRNTIHLPAAICIFAGTAIFSVSSAFAAGALVDRTGFYFDTVITVSLYDTDDESILDDCFEKMQYYENTFSRTVEGSDIWNINNSGGEPVEVSSDTIDILNAALSYCELTDGIFDITVESASSLWDFQAENPEVPDADILSEAVTHIDYTNIEIEGNTVTLKDPEAGIDLGAIAKGYISDRIRDILVEDGCESALISLGGNILALGTKPDGSPFTIGIRRPFGETSYDIIEKISVDGMSVITSGTYERYFVEDDRLYHHILDPSTGYPVDTELTSVSILSADGTQGDALSTVCFLLGTEDGMALIESIDGVEALFIDSEENLYASSGWNGTMID